MAANKGERLVVFLTRLRRSHPFANGVEARAAVERIMREVEDELSGIPENLHAADAQVTDGRMYPPHDAFEIKSDSPSVRTFKQTRHRTSFGENGAICITGVNGKLVLDLRGADGRNISELITEKCDERNSTSK